jgi:Zn-dependent peptidase ImmA (M78 family)/transcriptional regulator with XRE-family HTH domain
MSRITGFYGERLAQARLSKGLTATSLAEMIEVASSNVTLYEQGKQSPSTEVLDRIVVALNVPRDFFFKQPLGLNSSGIYYRSISAATKTARLRAEVRFMWLREIAVYLRKYLDLPRLSYPDFRLPSDPREISFAMIEELSVQCRDFYKLGDGPIPDLVALLESNGMIISRGETGQESLDALSQWAHDDDRPFIFLSSDKRSAVRSRFDCAHELAHVLLHRNVDPAFARSAQVHALLEKQGHYFASCFLLPESGFTRELYAPTIDGLMALKPRWKMSVAGMIKRVEDLGLVTEEQGRRLWINLTRRGWRKREPLDDSLVPEAPRILRRCFEVLIHSGVKTRNQILQDLRMRQSEIERLSGLPDGFLSEEVQVEPKLKEVSNPGVLMFRPKSG